MTVATRRGTLRPHDPFDLIRHLARSQTDPRKAAAELVQNSLDAGARRLVVTRMRERAVTVLKIADDGEGVLPDLTRVDALEHLAKNIGHSRKHNLSLEERRGALGHYGIGILGFWAIGEELELRTRVQGGPVMALVLREDQPGYRIIESALTPPVDKDDPLREPTCTEIVVRRVHDAALGAIAGRRLQDYLGFELRGQIRERGTRILVRDSLARGRGARVFRVEPRILEGVALAEPSHVEVPGFRPAKIELRVLPEGSRGSVALACGGAIVADDLSREPSLGLDHAPWTDARLSGVVDSPDLAPAPSSRRGIVPNRAAEALRRALVSVEGQVASALELACEAPAREIEREALARLRRAFSNLATELPRYELPMVRTSEARGGRPHDAPGLVAAGPDLEGAGVTEEDTSLDRAARMTEPLPPGDADDLTSVEIAPRSIVLPPGGSRNVRVIARDGAGREIRDELVVEWSIDDTTLVSLAHLEASNARLRAGEREGATRLLVRVTSAAGRSADTSADARVALPAGAPKTGIPDPVLIEDARNAWRTRFREGRWEVNSGHRDYQLVRDRGERRLGYLALLLSKEIVLRSDGGDPRIGEVLESLAEVAAYALRQL